MKLHTRILAGLAGGALIGALARPLGVAAAVVALEPIGTAFIQLVTMVVVPLVVGSVFVGVTSLGDVRRLGVIGRRTLSYFLITTLLAAVIGLAAGLLA